MADIDQKMWKYVYLQSMEEKDFSNNIAIEDGRCSYSYRQFFHNCEKYAAVFSALKMTGEDKARVGLIGTGAAETIFSLYGLNITGAEISVFSNLCAFKAERIMQVVRDEKLTDLIITDELIKEEALRTIVSKKEELGLRFIILLHVPVWGCSVPHQISMAFEQKAAITRALWGPIYMDFLVNVYGNHPIHYAENKSSSSAVTIHTSGTTGGSGKPIVMSDKAINAVARSVIEYDGYEGLKKDPSVGLMVDLSNAYGFMIQVHLPLSLGGKVAVVPGNALNPLFYRAIARHKITVLFCNGMIIDLWMKFPAIAGFDFSSLKFIVLGGSQISAADKKRYREFFTKHGCKDVPIVNGYGISEMGGVCTLSSEDIEDESVGHLLKGIDARFFDEETEQYHTLDEVPCTGVMYLNSDSMSTLDIDGKHIVDHIELDGKQFICTNDLFSVDADRNLTYLGRANRYFLHENGKKYQSGRVEAEISKQVGIGNCGVVPVFEKTKHDNIPMLCVTVTGEQADRQEIVRQALLNIFRDKKTLGIENIPLQVLIAQTLPRNSNGKVDLYKINKGEVSGSRYCVETTMKDGQLEDLQLRAVSRDDSNMVKDVYKSIAKDMFDESAAGQTINKVKSNDTVTEIIMNLFSNAFTTPTQKMNKMNMLYQLYCNTMMGWYCQMWQAYGNNSSSDNKDKEDD